MADPRVTACAGVEAVREVDRVLGLTAALEDGVGAVKRRRRGLSGGQLLTALACAQLTGADFWSRLDDRRQDVAGQVLEPVPTPASTTAAGIARRFGTGHLHGIETAVGVVNTRMVSMLGQVRRSTLLRAATIDGDTTEVEVHGRQERSAYNHVGQRNLRPHLTFWAEAGVPLAADLLAGAEDPRATCVDLLDRAIAALPAGVQQVRARWDAGYFAAALAVACAERGVQFAIGAKRHPSVLRIADRAARSAQTRWVPAIGMDDTDLAVIDYQPGQPHKPATPDRPHWPAGVACVARRTRIRACDLPTERARKRRTIPKEQLELALQGRLDEVYGYSFILTNLDVSTEQALAEVEWWYRHRTDIEALNKDGKHGAALRHLPSASHTVNSVWMWAALLACAISAWLQELTGLDHGNGRGRRTLARLRRDLICVPARISRRAGTTWLHPPPGGHVLAVVLPRLQRLPAHG